MRLMDAVLTAAAQRDADRITIEEFGLLGATLMETAGRGAARELCEANPAIAGKRVSVVAGPGNNGGDGYVIARVLHSLGARVSVYAAGHSRKMPPDAGHHRILLENVAVSASGQPLVIEPLENVLSSQADVYVDALLGSGITRPLSPALNKVVAHINRQSAFVLAVDLPTGLHADSGVVLGRAIRADLTVTMGAYKPGHFLGEGPAHCGRVIPIDIGIPPHVDQAVQEQHGGLWRSTDAAISTILPRRPGHAHKYSVGLALVVAGSPEFPGAAVLSSRAAARVGAGYVVCATHQSAQRAVAEKFTAIVTHALPESDPGEIDPAAASHALSGPIGKAKALVIGPGLGRAPGTQAFVRAVLVDSKLAAVVDADGLYGWAEQADSIAEHAQGRWILTPHDGEMARLTGSGDFSDRIRAAREWSKRWNVVLAMKGAPSLVGSPDGTVVICGSGSSALASAGTGDVLAGLCGGLLAQGCTPLEAAVAGLHLGGRCAEYYCKTRSARSMTAPDMLGTLPPVLKDLGG